MGTRGSFPGIKAAGA